LQYLNTIVTASTQMSDLIDGLLSFCRMGRDKLHEDVIDLDGLVRESIQKLEMAVKDRNIVWKIAPLPSVMGDVLMLRQVLVNLLDNAVKYSRLRPAAQIEIGSAGEEAGRVIFFVRDNGVGFDPQYRHKLFGVFQRLHRVDEFEGTGIGLANVRRIIARHGGRVWAESKLGESATFYFTLKPAPTQ
jgi:light-regulated signal transduction histidine kinase (bacteriophytochrome)